MFEFHILLTFFHYSYPWTQKEHLKEEESKGRAATEADEQHPCIRHEVAIFSALALQHQEDHDT